MAGHQVAADKTGEALARLTGLTEEALAGWQGYCSAAARRVTGLLRDPEGAFTPEDDALLEEAAAGMAWRMGLLQQTSRGPQTLEIGDLRAVSGKEGPNAARELETALLLAAGHLLRLSPHGLWQVGAGKEERL